MKRSSLARLAAGVPVLQPWVLPPVVMLIMLVILLRIRKAKAH